MTVIVMMIKTMMMIMTIMTHLVDDGQFPGQMVQTVSGQAGLDNTLQLGEDLPEVTGVRGGGLILTGV